MLLHVILVLLLIHPSLSLTKVAILGASGYTGVELLRILALHPEVKLSVLTADRSAGQEISKVFPSLAYKRAEYPLLSKWEDSEEQIKDCDVAFCCLPHGTTQEIISILANTSKVKIIDLSADFRLKNVATYEKWYGKPHAAPTLQKEAVYGLTEINRDKIKNARLLANPGCYPTAAQLPLIPLLSEKLIFSEDIIIDAKSGTSGAGRAAKEAFLYCEVADGIHAYGVASHRHSPEIEQGLTEAVESVNSWESKEVVINFTPHLMPMSRGILETIYVKMKPGVTAQDLKDSLIRKYENDAFVHVLPGGDLPQTRHVRGSNYCYMNVVADRIPGRAIIISAIASCGLDNLVKGAAGQAVQNMNLMLGYPETTALMQAPIFP